MNNQPALSTSAKFAVAALGVCGYVGGWLIIVLRGFHHAPLRHSSATTFVSGIQAQSMAIIFFALAAIVLVALLQSSTSKLLFYFFTCGVVFIPPLAFMLFA